MYMDGGELSAEMGGSPHSHDSYFMLYCRGFSEVGRVSFINQLLEHSVPDLQAVAVRKRGKCTRLSQVRSL